MRPLVGVTCNTYFDDGMLKHRAGDEYVAAVQQGADALPMLIPAATPPLSIEDILARVDGLLITGGISNVHPDLYDGVPPRPDTLLDPRRDAITLPLLKAAIAARKPLLCICRGFQELNVALGGTLHQHVHEIPGRLDHREKPDVSPDEEYGPAHSVRFTAGGLLAGWTGLEEAMVNSLHHQGIDRLAPGLTVEAVAPDGQIEAVSGGTGFLLAVQWHPEWRWSEDPVSRSIFQSFGAAINASRTESHGDRKPVFG